MPNLVIEICVTQLEMIKIIESTQMFDSIQAMSSWITWTIIHFLWMGLAVSIAIMALRAIAFERRPATNYRFHLVGLLAVIACIPISSNLATLNVNAQRFEPTKIQAKAVAESHLPNQDNSNSLVAESLDSIPNAVNDGIPTSQSGGMVIQSIINSSAPFIAAIYLVGVVFMLGRLMSMFVDCRRIKHATNVQDSKLTSVVKRLATEIGLRTAPAIQVTCQVVTPAIVGLFKPVLLVPTSLASSMTVHELEAILVHELAHIKRWDHVVVLIQRVAEAVFFFHPAVWYFSRELSRTRELCCDDMVIERGTCPLDYARGLCQVAEHVTHDQINSLVVMASGEDSTELLSRVRRVLGEPTKTKLGPSRFAILATTILVVSTLLLVPTFIPSVPVFANSCAAAIPAIPIQDAQSVGGNKRPTEPSPTEPSEQKALMESLPSSPKDETHKATEPVAQAEVETEKRLTFEETVAVLRAKGETDAADYLERRKKSADRFQQKFGWSYVFGKVVVKGKDSPRNCQSHLNIQNSGWFLGDVGKSREAGFNMFGYRPVTVKHRGQAGTLYNVGEIVMEPFQFDELGTVRAKLLFEGAVDPQDVSVRIKLVPPKSRLASGGTQGTSSSSGLEQEEALPDSNFQVQKTGLSPMLHRIHVKAPKHQPFNREFTIEPGGTTDVGVLRIAASPQFRIKYAASETLDFSDAEIHQTSEIVGGRFKTNPASDHYRASGGVSVREKDGNFSLRSGVYGFVQIDLGDKPFEDCLHPERPDVEKIRDADVNLIDGHSYLLYHHAKEWKHWTLLHVEISPFEDLDEKKD